MRRAQRVSELLELAYDSAVYEHSKTTHNFDLTKSGDMLVLHWKPQMVSVQTVYNILPMIPQKRAKIASFAAMGQLRPRVTSVIENLLRGVSHCANHVVPFDCTQYKPRAPLHSARPTHVYRRLCL